jgi:hypothetical protein
MYTNINRFFVEGPLAEFELFKKAYQSKNFGMHNDIRLAINSAVAFYHFHEFVFHEVNEINAEFKNSAAYSQSIIESFPGFIFVRDIANVSKHSTLDRGNPKISKADQLKEYIIITEYEDEKGDYRIATKAIVAMTDDSKEIDIYKLLAYTRYFRLNELFLLKILLEKPSEPNFEPKEIPVRESENGAAIMNLTSMQNVEFGMEMRVVKHNKNDY